MMDYWKSSKSSNCLSSNCTYKRNNCVG